MRTTYDFSGATVVITGAASGIGAASARAFAAAGASVWVLDLDAERGRQVAQEITAGGGRARFESCDVTRDEDVERALGAVLAEDGRIDVAYCNAGVGWIKPVSATEPDEWRKVLDIDLTGAFLVARRAFLAMRDNRSGVILFTGSPHGYRTMAETSVYAAAKAGLGGLMKALALEAAPYGIRVNSLLPGAVDTPALRAEAELSGDADDAIRRWGAIRPLGRIGRAEEVADLALFVASSSASFITGTELLVDGGAMAAQPAGLATVAPK
ncbi:SDR family NAD(P)-dependent oxidoreductase [Nonomuraea sp. CA-141351]|uniref:SDR family NAD(P)-dependent oxidoreductase n=1 Tax=Nonomuraea sp. CA-141351 TaxID=3239996 RepID=UPI003D8AF664